MSVLSNAFTDALIREMRHPALWGSAVGLVGAELGGMIGVLTGKPHSRLLSCLINVTGGLMLALGLAAGGVVMLMLR